LKNRFWQCQRPGFLPGVAGAEAAQLFKLGDAGGRKGWDAGAAKIDSAIASGIGWRKLMV